MSVEIEVTIKTKTDKAILVNDGVRDAWIPLSQIDDWSGCDDFEDLDTFPVLNVTLEIPEWLATEKGLV